MLRLSGDLQGLSLQLPVRHVRRRQLQRKRDEVGGEREKRDHERDLNSLGEVADEFLYFLPHGAAVYHLLLSVASGSDSHPYPFMI